VHKTFICILLLSFSVCFGSNKKATADYRSLVQRAKTGDQTVNFRDLRLAYMDSEDYERGPDTEVQKKAMLAALKEHNFKDALTSAEAVLAGDYADIDAHFVEYVSHRELKATELSDLHHFIFQGLLKSIADSGDGKSPETAFQVIDVHEEYVLLRAMGVGFPKSQSVMKKNGHSYDALTFGDPDTHKDTTLYFNVDIPAKHGL
jgi:hypothetical protein